MHVSCTHMNTDLKNTMHTNKMNSVNTDDLIVMLVSLKREQIFLLLKKNNEIEKHFIVGFWYSSMMEPLHMGAKPGCSCNTIAKIYTRHLST